MDAIPAFVKNHFGAKFDTNWDKIYKTIFEYAPHGGCGQNDNLKFSPWSSEKDVKNIILKNKQLKNLFGELIKLLPVYRDSVKTNNDDFEDFLETIKFIEYNYNRKNELLAFVNSKKTDLNSVETYLKKVALEDQIQSSKIYSTWCRGRRCNPNLIVKDCMWSFGTASDYSKHFSENPSEFIKILQERN
jgi:hypothetical protein